MSKGIIKSSVSIRSKIHDRIKELNLSLTDVSKDAKNRGANISVPLLSKYFKGSEKNNLSEESIIWLAYRYGIFISVTVGAIRMNEKGHLKYYTPDYDEKRNLELLAKIFPQNGNTKHDHKKVAAR